MTNNVNAALLASAQGALLFNVSKNTKAVYAKIDGDTLIWRCYFNEQPTEEERNDLSIAATEVIADFPQIMKCIEEYIVHPESINDYNEKVSDWPFVRKQ